MEEMSILITNEAKRELDKLLENSDKTCIRILTRHITMTTEAKIDLELDEPNARCRRSRCWTRNKYVTYNS